MSETKKRIPYHLREEERRRDKHYKLHRKKVDEMKFAIDRDLGDWNEHALLNLKKGKLLKYEERANDIKNENRHLLRKINAIVGRNDAEYAAGAAAAIMKSVREKEQRRVSAEKSKIEGRIGSEKERQAKGRKGVSFYGKEKETKKDDYENDYEDDYGSDEFTDDEKEKEEKEDTRSHSSSSSSDGEETLGSDFTDEEINRVLKAEKENSFRADSADSSKSRKSPGNNKGDESNYDGDDKSHNNDKDADKTKKNDKDEYDSDSSNKSTKVRARKYSTESVSNQTRRKDSLDFFEENKKDSPVHAKSRTATVTHSSDSEEEGAAKTRNRTRNKSRGSRKNSRNSTRNQSRKISAASRASVHTPAVVVTNENESLNTHRSGTFVNENKNKNDNDNAHVNEGSRSNSRINEPPVNDNNENKKTNNENAPRNYSRNSTTKDDDENHSDDDDTTENEVIKTSRRKSIVSDSDDGHNKSSSRKKDDSSDDGKSSRSSSRSSKSSRSNSGRKSNMTSRNSHFTVHNDDKNDST